MVTSGWASDFIQDQSQHRYMDGRDINTVNSMNSMNSAKNSKKSNYHAPTAAPPSAAFPNAFQSGDTCSTPTPGNTSTTNNMNNMTGMKNTKKGVYHSPTGPPAMPVHPSDFESGEVDSGSTPTNPTLGVNDMDRINNENSSKSGKKTNYHSSTAAPATVGCPSPSRSGQIESSFTPNSTSNMNSINRINNIDTAKIGKKGNYHSPTAAPAITGYPRGFQSGDIGLGSTRNHTNTLSTVSGMNTVNSAKSDKKVDNHSLTAALGIAGNPGSVQPSDIDLSSTRNRTNTLNNMTNVNNVIMANKWKKGTQNHLTATPATPAKSSAFRPSGIGPSSNAMEAAWEEQIDGITNRKYFYNSITKWSTWGEPNATVNRPPPPPPCPPPVSPIVEKREQDHWFRIGGKKGNKLWYNENTKMSLVDRPGCLWKYK